MNIIIATIKTWNIEKAKKYRKETSNHNIKVITEDQELTFENVSKFKPDYIFFPHWSKKIESKIFNNYECIVFHMTDLPYGRGGSPLQNLIERGREDTQISAIKVEEGLDSGDIYLKHPLNLNGSAEEIFIRASKIIFNEMIPEILKENLTPKKQVGKVVKFQRRKPYQSELKKDFSLKQIYNYIRMLDAEGYPEAFIDFDNVKLKFKNANLKHNKIEADVEIIRKEKEDE